MSGTKSAARFSTVDLGQGKDWILTRVDRRELGQVAAVATKRTREEVVGEDLESKEEWVALHPLL